jgi:hypothetical protein
MSGLRRGANGALPLTSWSARGDVQSLATLGRPASRTFPKGCAARDHDRGLSDTRGRRHTSGGLAPSDRTRCGSPDPPNSADPLRTAGRRRRNRFRSRLDSRRRRRRPRRTLPSRPLRGRGRNRKFQTGNRRSRCRNGPEHKACNHALRNRRRPRRRRGPHFHIGSEGRSRPGNRGCRSVRAPRSGSRCRGLRPILRSVRSVRSVRPRRHRRPDLAIARRSKRALPCRTSTPRGPPVPRSEQNPSAYPTGRLSRARVGCNIARTATAATSPYSRACVRTSSASTIRPRS